MRARICLFLNRLGAQRVSSRHVHEKAKHAVAHLHETIPPPQNRLISEEYKITGGLFGVILCSEDARQLLLIGKVAQLKRISWTTKEC